MTRPRSVGVLVVDDSEALGSMLVEVLERNGYPTRWVSSATAALSAVEDERPDVVLLDLNLGESDGLELARELRAISDLKPMRIIGLSGDPPTPRQRRSLNGFLLKPVVLPALLEALQG